MEKFNPAIVCIDDDRTILESLKIQLSQGLDHHYLIEVAMDAIEALELIDDLILDEINVLVIVSDWLMPGMKGDEFLVKVHQKYPQIVKIMLSGQADEKAIQNSVENANLYSFISKPWDRENLINIIKEGINSLEISK